MTRGNMSRGKCPVPALGIPMLFTHSTDELRMRACASPTAVRPIIMLFSVRHPSTGVCVVGYIQDRPAEHLNTASFSCRQTASGAGQQTAAEMKQVLCVCATFLRWDIWLAYIVICRLSISPILTLRPHFAVESRPLLSLTTRVVSHTVCHMFCSYNI